MKLYPIFIFLFHCKILNISVAYISSDIYIYSIYIYIYISYNIFDDIFD